MNARMSFCLLVALAFAVRCVELYTSGLWEHPLMREPSEEVLMAQGIADGQGFITPFRRDGQYVQDPSAYSSPAYPYLLGGIIKLVRWITPDPLAPYRVALLLGIFVVSIAMGLIGLSGGCVLGRHGFWVIGILATLWPPLITNSTILWDTPYTILGVCFGLWLGVAPRQESRNLTFSLVWGFLAGLFMLFNPVVGPFLVAALAAHLLRRPRCKATLAICAFALAACAVCLAPWFIRNAVVFHRFVPIRNTFGYALWAGNQPGEDGRATSTYKYMLGANAGEVQQLFEMGEDAYIQAKTREALAIIRADPGAYLKRTAQRIVLHWLGDLQSQTVVCGVRFPMFFGTNVLKASINALIIACTLAGTFVWGPRPGKWVIWVGLMVLPLPYYLTHYSSTYRVFTDPLLCVLTGTFLNWLLTRWVYRKWLPMGRPDS